MFSYFQTSDSTVTIFVYMVLCVISCFSGDLSEEAQRMFYCGLPDGTVTLSGKSGTTHTVQVHVLYHVLECLINNLVHLTKLQNKGHISISHESPWIDQGQKCVRLVLKNILHEGIPDSQCNKMVIHIQLGAALLSQESSFSQQLQ